MNNRSKKTEVRSWNYLGVQPDSQSIKQKSINIIFLILNRKYYFLIISALLFTSCDTQPPIPDEKFLELYVDLLIIQDTTATTDFSLDSVKTLVLERYNVSSGQYDAMIKYYNSEPEKWIAFFDSATVYVDRLKAESENQP